MPAEFDGGPDPHRASDPHGVPESREASDPAWVPDVRLRRLVDRLSDRFGHRSEPEPRPGHTEAAVSLILRTAAELEVLLIKRAESERDPWSGHVALPGGRRDLEDANLTQTAIRETSEETGVELASAGWPLGRLARLEPSHPNLPPITISPYVFGVPTQIEASANSREVDQVLWVSLPLLFHPETRGTTTIQLPEGPADFPCYNVEGYVVWGLTFRILSEFGGFADGL
jgi:8-oxo-dGTP pyrophosphatase MutT (NUDIX family)